MSTAAVRRSEKIQHSADVSLVWFEHVDRFWDFDPVQFAFGVMTRAKAITYDNLTLRAPDFVAEVDKAFALQVQRQGVSTSMSNKPAAPMFQPHEAARHDAGQPHRGVADVHVLGRKRACPAIFTWCTTASRADRRRRSHVFTEMTCVSAATHALRRAVPDCGMTSSRRHGRRIVDFVHGNSAAKIASAVGTRRPQGRHQTDVGRYGPSALAEGGVGCRCRPRRFRIFPDSQVPREMDRTAMEAVKAEFVQAAALRGDACGFDMLELHCCSRLSAGQLHLAAHQPAHRRSTVVRWTTGCAFPLEIFAAMRAAWPAHKPMSVRISATDWAEGGIVGDDAVAIARAFAEAWRRSGGRLHRPDSARRAADLRPHVPDPVLRAGPQRGARIATMCVGNITSADQVNTILAAGRADLVALGRPHLIDPSFTIRGCGLVRRQDIAYCPPPYHAWQRPDLPQQRPRPAGFRRSED